MSSEAKISFTTKVDGDLWTFRGDTMQEFLGHVDEVLLSDKPLDKIRALQAEIRGAAAAAEAAVAQAFDATPAAPAPTTAASAAVETLTDKYGNSWTYGLPQAPQSINGYMVLKEGKSKAGKPYKGWFDATKGPKPVKPVGPAADPQWID